MANDPSTESVEFVNFVVEGMAAIDVIGRPVLVKNMGVTKTTEVGMYPMLYCNTEEVTDADVNTNTLGGFTKYAGRQHAVKASARVPSVCRSWSMLASAGALNSSNAQ